MNDMTEVGKDKFGFIHGHVEHQELHVPPLEQLCKVLTLALKENFREAVARVVNCPDLTKKPWNLAAPGMCGNPRLSIVGGVPYLIPIPNLSKVYSFDVVAKQAEMPNGFLMGPGAGSSRAIGINCEMMANLKLDPEVIRSKMAKVNPKDDSAELHNYNEKEFALLADLLISDGKRGEVVEVVAKSRKGHHDFVSCMRQAIEQFYGNIKTVGMGGVFCIESGKARLHVMPAYSKDALQSDKMVEEWLNFYAMDAPLVCLSVFISNDPGLDIRLQHTHCFSDHGQGGHYHEDITPEEVIYHGYFVPAEYIYRIDRPASTHLIGRD